MRECKLPTQRTLRTQGLVDENLSFIVILSLRFYSAFLRVLCVLSVERLICFRRCDDLVTMLILIRRTVYYERGIASAARPVYTVSSHIKREVPQ